MLRSDFPTLLLDRPEKAVFENAQGIYILAKRTDHRDMSTCKILFLEDEPQDVELMERELKKSGFKFLSRRVVSKKDFLKSLDSFQPDVILADYSLPMFNGMHAFRLFREKNICIPFILVTGALTEEIASECLGEGIDDFVLKSAFKRLPLVMQRSLEIKHAEREKKKIAHELEQRNTELNVLRAKAEKSRASALLSTREYEILCHVANGKSVKEIAHLLKISPTTVATYRARLLEKMNLRSNVDITRYALRNRLID